jgi:hypothetical protein
MTHIKFHKEQVEKIKTTSNRTNLGDKSVRIPHSLGLSSHGRRHSSGSEFLETRTEQSFPELKTLPYLLSTAVWKRVFLPWRILKSVRVRVPRNPGIQSNLTENERKKCLKLQRVKIRTEMNCVADIRSQVPDGGFCLWGPRNP